MAFNWDKRYQNRKKRREYLNDYHKDINGKYVYYGQYWFLPEQQRKSAKLKMILACVLVFILTIGSGCIPAGGICGVPYVVIMYLLEILSMFFLIWLSGKILLEGEMVKDHVYKKSVPYMPVVCVAGMISNFASIVADVIYLCISGMGGKVFLCLLYLIIKVLCGLIYFYMFRTFRSLEWSTFDDKKE